MIHQYINNGYNIVLDVNSGSVHVVDPLSYELIALADKRLEEGKSEEEILTEARSSSRISIPKRILPKHLVRSGS